MGRDARGFTLIELLVAMSLLLIGLVMFTSVLYTVQQASKRQSDLSRANDAARLAMQEIDRQVRSGYVATALSPDPAFAGADAVARIYTEARVASASDRPQCVAWLLAGSASGLQTLYTRSWDAGDAVPGFSLASPGGWRVVAEGITNASNGGSAQTFQIAGSSWVTDSTLVPPSPVPIGQRLVVSFWFDPAGANDDRAINITSTVTSRNVPRAVTYIDSDPSDSNPGTPVYDLCG